MDWKKVGIAVVVLGTVAAAGYFVWTNRPTPKTGVIEKTGEIEQAADLDTFMDALAKRTANGIGNADDFQVVVTQAAYPVGTLLRRGSTIPVHKNACRPTSEGDKVATPSLYPAFRINREIAANFGLGEAVPLLSGSTAGGSQNTTFTVSFADPGIRVLDDSEITGLIATDACKAALGDKSVWLVRGYVVGKRKFQLTEVRDNDVKAKLALISNLQFTPKSDSVVELSDAAETGFLQIVSEVSAPKAGATVVEAARPDASVPIVNNSGPSVFPTIAKTVRPVARIYVQRDVADGSGAGEMIVAALASPTVRVERHIEAIDSAKMPTTAQVRYFNRADEPIARQAQTVLAQTFPGAAITRIALPAPAGQLEIWLPRAAPKN